MNSHLLSDSAFHRSSETFTERTFPKVTYPRVRLKARTARETPRPKESTATRRVEPFIISVLIIIPQRLFGDVLSPREGRRHILHLL